MNNSDGQVIAVVRTAQLIHAAITLGLISFGAVVAFIMFSGAEASVTQGPNAAMENFPFKVVGIAVPLGGTAFALVIRGLIGRSAQGQNAAGGIMLRHIMFIAFLEGCGLLGVVVSLISNTPYGLIATVIPLIALLVTWPTRARFDPEYDPRTATRG